MFSARLLIELPSSSRLAQSAILVYLHTMNKTRVAKFKLGIEYQYWKNKFGNSASIAGPGSFAKTPMIRAEYHF